jgi:hypothetical protein
MIEVEAGVSSAAARCLGVAAWFIGCLEVNAVVAEHIWLGNNLRDEMRNRKLGENAPTGAGPNNGLIVSERLDR